MHVRARRYGMADFKIDLLALYMRAGLKGIGVSFLLTDGQIVDDRFLVLLNDFLSSGNVADLFDFDTKEEVLSSIRGEVKAAGIADTRENSWDFFISKVFNPRHTRPHARLPAPCPPTRTASCLPTQHATFAHRSGNICTSCSAAHPLATSSACVHVSSRH